MNVKGKSLGQEYEDYKDFVSFVEGKLDDAAAKSSNAERWSGEECLDKTEYEKLRKRGFEDRIRFRTPFQHDRDTILYSSSFAALAGKTQMLIGNKASILRTRLTHSLFVSQLARSIGRGLGLNEDLIDAIGLGHDLGHTPFAHAGEWGINAWLYEEISRRFLKDNEQQEMEFELSRTNPVAELLRPAFLVAGNENGLALIQSPDMKERRLFLHAKQSFKRLCHFEGQNPTKQVLFGIWRHSGRCFADDCDFSYVEGGQTLNANYLTYEAQVVRLADDIAWVAHDIKDATQAKLIDRATLAQMRMGFAGTEKITISDIGNDANWISMFVNDAIIHNHGALDKDALTACEHKIDLSENKQEILKKLKEAVYKVHNDEEVHRSNECAIRVLKELCGWYENHQDKFLADMKRIKDKREMEFYSQEDVKREWDEEITRMGMVCDFISTLTDEEAFELHKRYFSAEAYIKPIFGI